MICFRTMPHLLMALYFKSWYGCVSPGMPIPTAAPGPTVMPVFLLLLLASPTLLYRKFPSISAALLF